jgi:hypothetical protein
MTTILPHRDDHILFSEYNTTFTYQVGMYNVITTGTDPFQGNNLSAEFTVVVTDEYHPSCYDSRCEIDTTIFNSLS